MTTSGCGCVVLAAGAGVRFGGDKLMAPFRGKALYLRALDVLPAEEFTRVAVVSGREEILSEAARRGFLPVENLRPEEGVSRSIRLGLETMDGCERVLFLVCDQPLLQKETVRRILSAGQEHPEKIIVPCVPGGRSGNPCLFPAGFFAELLALDGDKGGKRVIAAHPEAAFCVAVEERELFDTDTVAALEELEKGDRP